MATEEYSTGYAEGHQDGWNAAMDSLPAKRTWVGLTHDEYDAICDKHSAMSDFDFLADIEVKLKEKNNV